MGESQRSVLVIGDDMRIFLSVARSLGRAGLDVHAMPFDWHAPALKSRYVRHVHRLPRYGDDPRGWLTQFQTLTQSHRFELIVPTCDRAIHPIHEHREVLSDQCLAIPAADAIPTLFDKERTHQMCDVLGIPTARGRRLGHGETAEELASEFGLPLVLKPRQSYWIDSLDTWGRVWIVDSLDELRNLLSELPDPDRYLIESWFDGQGVGVSVLADRGNILQAFQHRRLREGRGGSSTYRVSESLHPALLRAAGNVAGRLGLTGVCMFEFRHDPATDRWILLETNARFWGSMSLPLSLGVDFPRYLFDLLVDDRRHDGVTYRPGVRSRNLVLDGHNLLGRMFGPRRAPVTEIGADIADFLGQPMRWVTGKERSDSFTRDDPGPGFAELGALVRRAADRTASSPGSLSRRSADRRPALRAVND